MKPPQITNRHKFPEIHRQDCDPFRVIRSIFPSMNTHLYIYFFNHRKIILHFNIQLNNL